VAITWNPSDKESAIVLSGGNLVATNSTTAHNATLRATSSVSSGKWHWETTIGGTLDPNASPTGIATSLASLSTYLGDQDDSLGWFNDGSVYLNDVVVATVATFAAGNRLVVEFDASAKLIWLAVGAGNWNNSGTANPATGTGGISTAGITGSTLFPAATLYATTDSVTVHFLAGSFTRGISSGFSAYEVPTGSVIAAAGVATTGAAGASTKTGSGSIAGIATTGAAGRSTKAGAGGTVAGVATAASAGSATKAGSGTSSGIATATAAGASTGTVSGVGTSPGSATAAAVAASVKSSSGGTVAGLATASAAGNTSKAGTIGAAGLATAGAASQATKQGAAGTAGTSTAAAAGASSMFGFADGVGQAAGSSTAVAVSSDATPIAPVIVGGGGSELGIRWDRHREEARSLRDTIARAFKDSSPEARAVVEALPPEVTEQTAPAVVEALVASNASVASNELRAIPATIDLTPIAAELALLGEALAAYENFLAERDEEEVLILLMWAAAA
jgi:hypothetical protein